ncbi:MAG: ABC transporter ATP-binding protein [Clostridiales bacterium]|nr:ABC transporter ATP-binding protein [Clostridiales bacterium]
MWSKVLKYLKGYRLFAVLTPICIFFEVLLEVYIPFIMAQIIDIGVAEGDLDYIISKGLQMILMAFLALLLGVLAAYFSSKAGSGLEKNVRQGLYYKIQDFSFANIDKFSTPSLVTRLTTDIVNTKMSFIMTIRMLARAPFMFVFAIVMAVRLNAELSLVFLFAVPVLIVTLVLITTKAFPKFRVMLEKYDKLNGVVQENLIATRVVKAFVRGDFEKDKFDDIASQVRDTQVKAERIVIWNMPVMQLVIYSCIIAVAWFGGNKIVVGDMQAGQLISFISYITQILVSLMMVSMVLVFLVMARASVQRIVEVLDEEPEIKNPKQGTNPPVEDGSVVFENVSFSYSDGESPYVLEDIDFTIESGETLGIIGGTGSSKTSLVSLIPRLYDVSKGRLLVGGKDVREYNLDTLRDSVAIVLQKNVLFSGTIKDNLKWGNEHATDEEIIEACKIAMAHDFIMSFPAGYDTYLGQGGVNVSGGQKQRISIARSLLKNPKIIILDDSTSAVDTKTESSIRHALRTKLKETTTIIISQRVSSIKDADKILVLDDGKINGLGTHDELMENNKIYREIYESQQKGVALGE